MEILQHMNPGGLILHLFALAIVALGVLGVFVAAIWEHFAAPRREFRAAYGRRKASRLSDWGF